MSLSHSNIVQVLDLGASAGRYFLVLELVDGWDLGRVLHRAAACRRAPPARAVAAHHRGGLPGAGLRARQDRRAAAAGDRPPRRQPAQRPAVRAGRGEADRLRHRQGDEQARAHRRGRREGEGRLHVARAGARQADRRAVGPVLAGDRPLFAGHADAPVRRGQRAGDAAARAKGRVPPARRGGARSAPGGGGVGRARHAARPRPALPDRRRDAGRRRARAAHRLPPGRPERAEEVAGRSQRARRGAPDQPRGGARDTRPAATSWTSRTSCCWTPTRT